MNSYNHYAYGAIGDFLFGTVAGIDIDDSNAEAGYRQVRLQPMPGGTLQHAEATHESPYGLIRSAWQRLTDGGLAYEATVPANSAANVFLQGAVLAGVSEAGLALDQAEGISAVEETPEGVRFRVASGDYVFRIADSSM